MSRDHIVIRCDYCYAIAELVDDSEVYGRLYRGKVYMCRPCNAWVGTHPGGTKPLGRLANASLRQAKVQAHAAFDALWKNAMQLRGWSKTHARAKAYKWLAHSMGIDPRYCHIGMFNESQCALVVQLCRERKPNPAIPTDAKQ